jgi:hypothetical protein
MTKDSRKLLIRIKTYEPGQKNLTWKFFKGKLVHKVSNSPDTRGPATAIRKTGYKAYTEVSQRVSKPY